jgi:hypothetical protein
MSYGFARVAVLTGCVLAHRAQAQAAPRPDFVGSWRGTSLCLVRPSACNDEVVVYRITRANTSDSLSMDARKIVNAKEEDMGVLACRLISASAQFTCRIPNGVWGFTIRRDTLVGEFRLTDGTKYRDVRAVRSP